MYSYKPKLQKTCVRLELTILVSVAQNYTYLANTFLKNKHLRDTEELNLIYLICNQTVNPLQHISLFKKRDID